MFHKTVFRSFDVIGVVPGRYFPKDHQTHYLFNLGTSFEIFSLALAKNKQDLVSKHFQRLFSKALHICNGPNVDEVDTFFVVRETDVVQFQYSESDKLFVSINYINLPSVAITPNYGYYDFDNDQLIISCFHGGICTIDTSKPQWQVITAVKPSTFALCSFPAYKDCFFRVETDSQLVLYRRFPFQIENKVEYKTERDRDKILYSFPFGNDSVIFCTSIQLLCHSTSSVSEISFPRELDFERIVYHSPITPSDVLLLTYKGTILRLRSDLSLTVISRLDPTQTNYRLRVFNLDGSLGLIINRAIDPVLIDLDTNSHGRMRPLENASIGLSNIIIDSPKIHSQDMFPFSPQIFSYSADQLLIFRQGKQLNLRCYFELPDQPTGIFLFKHQSQTYLLISYEQCSTLLEIQQDVDGVKLASIPYYENCKTIAIVNRAQSDYFFHITPHLLTSLPTGKIKPSQSTEEMLFFITNNYSTQIIQIFEKNRLIFNGKLILHTDPITVAENKSYKEELRYTVTCLKFMPEVFVGQDALSEHVAFGAEYKDPTTNQTTYHIFIRVLSTDEVEREDIIDFPVSSPVCSIEFNYPNNEKPTGIFVGLENGSMIVGDVLFEKKVIVLKQVLQLGSCPCHIRMFPNDNQPTVPPNYPKKLGFAYSSRLFGLKLAQKKNQVVPIPFLIDTPQFLELDSRNRIFVVSGKTLSIYTPKISRKIATPDLAVLRKKIPSPIVDIKMWDGLTKLRTKIDLLLMFIVCQKHILLMDVTSPDSFVEIQQFNEETVTHACYTPNLSTQRARDPLRFGVTPLLCVSTISKQEINGKLADFIGFHIFTVNNYYYSYLGGHKQGSNEKSVPLEKYYSRRFHRMQMGSIDAIAIISTNKDESMPPDPFVFIGIHNTLHVFQVRNQVRNQELSKLASMSHLGVKIKDILVKQEKDQIYLLVADEQRSVTMLNFNQNKNQLLVVMEEGVPRSISSHLTPISQVNYCGGDMLGNIFGFQAYNRFYSVYIPKPSGSSNKVTSSLIPSQKPNLCSRRFYLFMCMNVGDIVTGIAPTNSDPNSWYYSTIGGGIGCFIESFKFEKELKLLKKVQNEVTNLLLVLTHCDPIQFRNKYYNTATICDMDLVEVYHSLSTIRKEEIIDKINELNMATKDPKDDKPYEPITLDSLELTILNCNNYFWMWNSDRK